MLLFYVRHGDPIYNPDSLTPLGKRQAEAVAKRLALYGVDKIFSSTSNRAIETAQPTCEILKKEMTLCDFANEHYAWQELTYTDEKGRDWLFHHSSVKPLLTEPELLKLGFNWYEHPKFKDFDYKKGFYRIQKESDKFLAELGFEHIPFTGRYKVAKPNSERVALFAHQGFGLAFLSAILDIPYPMFTAHFDMTHTGMTGIDFGEGNGFAVPKILTLSNDSHIYKEGLPTNYNNSKRF